MRASEVFSRIPYSELSKFIGRPIHIAWASKGCVWILDKIDGDKVYCHMPKTGRHYIDKASDVCYTRQSQPARDFDF